MYDVYDNKYTTTQGETWDMISMSIYGSPYKVSELISCNREYSDVLIFDGNIHLSVPILTKEKYTTLAPWKRGA